MQLLFLYSVWKVTTADGILTGRLPQKTTAKTTAKPATFLLTVCLIVNPTPAPVTLSAWALELYSWCYSQRSYSYELGCTGSGYVTIQRVENKWKIIAPSLKTNTLFLYSWCVLCIHKGHYGKMKKTLIKILLEKYCCWQPWPLWVCMFTHNS